MNRIDKKIASNQAQGKKVLSPYLTAGDPNPESTVPLMHALVAAGADILELGIPFSDPMAEGVVIQAAMERSLAQGTNTESVLSMIKTFREKDKDTPVILMGYLNPIEQYGYKAFAARAQEVGVDGLILVDLPPEEAGTLDKIWSEHGLYCIYLCSPTTSAKRMAIINQYAKGYLYYVSLKGVTGADLNFSSFYKLYQQRKSETSLPLMVGFGIKTPEMAAKVASVADGVVVGAALISKIQEADEKRQDLNQAAASLISSMRQAMNNV